ncbi:general L-amino acid transport system permease protein [Rhodoblastus acidophilus]|uniref:ABC transporter permease subunit n=1 Tax=Rhodoblastus acidophilus TaxID=1074 RepID=UPI0022243784|nr:ABC transporter permease subunit [Rhodoblastus acidophilus]MCW2315362.1 general L-amino acid transport system permease protein [Rhodoblastus acidophilus]
MTRRVALQILLLLLVAGLFGAAFMNAKANLEARNIPTSFAFLWQTAGFGLNQSLIPYSPLDSYGRALLSGALNTLIVSLIASALATVFGFAVGFARLSPHWALARLAGLYVESLRNIPLLLHLLFWYIVLLAPLPAPEHSVSLGGIVLNNRGIYFPFPLLGWPAFEPARNAFNVEGGLRLAPEAAAMIAGLTFYTSSYIAEILRAGVQAVARGQSEAALALGLSAAQTRKLVVLPQALRVALPPLVSQYLALTKNSSLAAFIGFADLMQVSGTILNQTGAALQTLAADMALYFGLSVLTLALMRRIERGSDWGAR